MDGEKREFRGVWFPAEVWLDERLTALEKIILIEIDSLDGEHGCFASNEYLAEFCQCSQTKVSSAISKLKKLGYVRVESFDGRTRILRSSLSNSESLPFKKSESDTQKKEQRILEDKPTKETKKEARETFDSIIQEYTTNSELREALGDFLRYRKARGKGFTNRALKLNLTKLSKLSSDPTEQTLIVYQTIERGWSGFFELKDGGFAQGNSRPKPSEAFARDFGDQQVIDFE